MLNAIDDGTFFMSDNNVFFMMVFWTISISALAVILSLPFGTEEKQKLAMKHFFILGFIVSVAWMLVDKWAGAGLNCLWIGFGLLPFIFMGISTTLWFIFEITEIIENE